MSFRSLNALQSSLFHDVRQLRAVVLSKPLPCARLKTLLNQIPRLDRTRIYGLSGDRLFHTYTRRAGCGDLPPLACKEEIHPILRQDHGAGLHILEQDLKSEAGAGHGPSSDHLYSSTGHEARVPVNKALLESGNQEDFSSKDDKQDGQAPQTSSVFNIASFRNLLFRYGQLRRSRLQVYQEWVLLYQVLCAAKEGNAELPRLFTTRRLFAKRLGASLEPEETTKRWLETPLTSRPSVFVSLMTGCLTLGPKEVLHTLASIRNHLEWEHRHRVYAECLMYLFRFHKDQISQDSALNGAFATELGHLRNGEDFWPADGMPYPHLVLLLNGGSSEDRYDSAQKYVARYPGMSKEAKLFLVDFYTQNGHVDDAIKCLHSLGQELLYESSDDILRRCYRLLYLDSVEQAGSSQNFKILPRLLEMGIRVNDTLHNVIIRNAVREGLPTIAWDLFRHMKSEKIQVFGKTFDILLRDSFRRQAFQNLDEIMSDIHQRVELLRNPYIVAYAMNIVRVVCSHHRKLPPQESLQHLVAVYDRVFDRAPLVQLNIVSAKETTTQESLPPPGPASLAFTLWTYVLFQNQDIVVSRLWSTLVSLVEAGHPAMTEAAKHDVLYNGFLVFYSRYFTKQREALEVFRTMLDLKLCRPTSKTWSIMISSFLKYGRQELAQEAMKMMKDRGEAMDARGWAYIHDMLNQRSRPGFVTRLNTYLEQFGMPEAVALALASESKISRSEPGSDELHEEQGLDTSQDIWKAPDDVWDGLVEVDSRSETEAVPDQQLEEMRSSNEDASPL